MFLAFFFFSFCPRPPYELSRRKRTSLASFTPPPPPNLLAFQQFLYYYIIIITTTINHYSFVQFCSLFEDLYISCQSIWRASLFFKLLGCRSDVRTKIFSPYPLCLCIKISFGNWVGWISHPEPRFLYNREPSTPNKNTRNKWNPCFWSQNWQKLTCDNTVAVESIGLPLLGRSWGRISRCSEGGPRSDFYCRRFAGVTKL